MNEENEGRINQLNDTLNSRTRYNNPVDVRHPVKSVDMPDVETKWNSPELNTMLGQNREEHKVSPVMKKIFLFAILFFFAAIAVAGFVFVGGSNFVSSRNVDINALGPTTISAGEVLQLGVTISNTNNADLEFANFAIQYPQGTKDADNTSQGLTYVKKDLGVIKAGTESVQDVRMILLGSTGDVKEIKFSVEYKVKGSNATFFKEKAYEVVIGNAPITLTLDSPTSITSGETFTTDLTVTLNSPETLRNVVLKAEYPYGYRVSETSPEAQADKNVWALGDLSPGDKKRITIKGSLTGENSEERTFRFYVGVSESNIFNANLNVVVASLLNTVSINRPSIGLNVAFNGDKSQPYIAPAGKIISTLVSFQNNLSEKLINPKLEVTMSGPAFDKKAVSVGSGGEYDEGNAKASWMLTGSQGISELLPGDSKQLTFNFASLPSTSLSGNSNEIYLNFSLTGVPVGTQGNNPIVVTETRTIKISSQVSLTGRTLYSLGPFVNSGPIPPKVGQETTYSINLNVGNTKGDITESKITAKLGSNVTWVSANSSASENIKYDETTNVITWDMGTLRSGTGFSAAAREVYFQVKLKPTVGQVGTTPVLVNNISFSGTDSTTQQADNMSLSPLTTKLSNDPSFIQGDDIVVQ